jgi:hypothetical protein
LIDGDKDFCSHSVNPKLIWYNKKPDRLYQSPNIKKNNQSYEGYANRGNYHTTTTHNHPKDEKNDRLTAAILNKLK